MATRFGRKIRGLRRARGLSLRELETIMELPRGRLSHFEGNPSDKRLSKPPRNADAILLALECIPVIATRNCDEREQDVEMARFFFSIAVRQYDTLFAFGDIAMFIRETTPKGDSEELRELEAVTVGTLDLLVAQWKDALRASLTGTSNWRCYRPLTRLVRRAP